MDKSVLNRAKEIEAEIEVLFNKVEYFKTREERVPSCDIKKKGFFDLKGFFNRGKPYINIVPKGFLGGSNIEVDEEFMRHCELFFKEKLDKKKKELEEL